MISRWLLKCAESSALAMSFSLRNGVPRKLLPSRIEAARSALERSQLYEAESRVEAVEHRRKADDMEHNANEHKRIAEELAREIADMVFELKEVDTAKLLAETKDLVISALPQSHAKYTCDCMSDCKNDCMDGFQVEAKEHQDYDKQLETRQHPAKCSSSQRQTKKRRSALNYKEKPIKLRNYHKKRSGSKAEEVPASYKLPHRPDKEPTANTARRFDIGRRKSRGNWFCTNVFDVDAIADALAAIKDITVTNVLNGESRHLRGSCIQDIRARLEYIYPGCNIRLFDKHQEIFYVNRSACNLNFIKEADSRKAIIFLKDLIDRFISYTLFELRCTDVWNKGTDLVPWREEDTHRATFALRMVQLGHPTTEDADDLFKLFVRVLTIFFPLHHKHVSQDISSVHPPEELINLVGITVGDICAPSYASLLADVHYRCNYIGRCFIDTSISRLSTRQ